MTHKVLIDYNKLGWAEENKDAIGRDYSEILRAGDGSNPGQDADDGEIASFCKENNCDLLTGDKRAYGSFLRNSHVKAVQISEYGPEDAAKQQVYLIKII